MKPWQQILNGKNQSSNTIKEEILTLTNNGKELESGLVELEATLQELQKRLLAEDSGFDEVQKAERAISENKSKASAIKDILKDLGTELQKSLIAETKNRQEEIVKKIAAIDAEATEKRIELVETYARACILYAEITGQDPSRLSFDFFLNNRMTDELHRQIDAGISEKEGPSLYSRREQLLRESTQLIKKSIS